MSFLIRRNPPWAWAGWIDSFNRPVENPIRQPWAHFGDGIAADLNDLQEMRVPGHFLSTIGGGESYEFQPFTPNFTMEWEMWWPVSGLAAQYFNLAVMENWSKVGPSFANSFMIRLVHAPSGVGIQVHVTEFDGLLTLGAIRSSSNHAGFAGVVLHCKVMVDADSLVRVYINDNLYGQAIISSGHRPRPGKRGLNFFNNSLADAWIRWVRVYDRPSLIVPADQWTSLFYDGFNLPENSEPASGWIKIGDGGLLLSGSYTTTSTSNSGLAILRDTSVTTGRQRIEATVGGAIGPSTTAYSSLLLRGNAEGTQGIMCGVFGNQIALGRYSDTLAGNPTTVLTWVATGATVTNGDVIAFSAVGGTAWAEVNGSLVAIAGHVADVVPETNSHMGLRVERRSDVNSHSWNDVRLMSS